MFFVGGYMNKEQLIRLRKEIGELSEKDLVERDIYLRGLATGDIMGPPLGIPSIDKPWLSNYTESDIRSNITAIGMYEEIRKVCCKYSKNIAIEYFGKKITYWELLENIDLVANKFAKFFDEKKLRVGDMVTVSMPYLPETIYVIYALNKMGLVVNMVDPRINSELFTRYVKNADSKVAIVIDKIEDKIANIQEDSGLEDVISVSPMNSMGNIVLRMVGKLKKSKYTKWNKFVSSNKDRYISTIKDKEQLAVIEYTSGTSGEPKGVMLANESFNYLSLFQQQSCCMEEGSKFLLIMPPFIAYGLVIGMHNMLCQGQHLLMIPNFTLDKAPKMLPELIDKYHPNWIMGVPNFLQILMDYNKDLSFLKGIIIGGDHLDPQIESNARKYFLEHNSDCQIYKGWGMTELSSCGSFTKLDSVNHIGSVGIPLSKNNVKILPQKKDGDSGYNIDDLELGYGSSGVLFMSSPAMTLGYYKNKEATDNTIYVDAAGTRWMNTGDIFTISEDGALFFNRREKRVVVRPDGHNIPTEHIELVGSSFSEVANSIVVGTPCEKYEHGHYATLCVTLNNREMSLDDRRILLNKIAWKCQNELQPRDRAKYYVIVDSIPYTMNAKVDYDKLMNDVNEKIRNLKLNEDSAEEFYINIDTLIDCKNQIHDKYKKKTLKI